MHGASASAERDTARQIFGQGNVMKDTGQTLLCDARIAVILPHRKVVIGSANSEQDSTLGRVVRIDLGDSQPGRPALIIAQEQWDANSQPDTEHGCDFRFVLDVEACLPETKQVL